MKIELKKITVGELAEGYSDKGDDGVLGYGGNLDIRPPYQREFVYNHEQRASVIDTVAAGFPLNVMYWSVREGGGFEMIDGQQRTISICQFVAGDFSHTFGDFPGARFWGGLQEDEQERFLQYKLMVYHCRGEPSERLKWFETINFAGEKLRKQEMRNAIYHGTWVSSARSYFSKRGCAAHDLGKPYMKGSAIHQDYLETVIEWIRGKESVSSIEEYMASHQFDADAEPLWDYFEAVIEWVAAIFPKHHREMKGLDWGIWYNQVGEIPQDVDKLESEVGRLMGDVEVQKKSGIYEYLLTGNERALNLRAFNDDEKRTVYEEQEGYCKKCNEHFELDDMEADHITPWTEGGKTIPDNCQMLCKDCNRRKSSK